MVQLIEQSTAALDEVVDVTGRTMIELILQVSADRVAGGKSPGKRTGEIRHHGTQDGVVHLKERKLRVKRPRLRHRTDGEVQIPAYEAMRTRPRMTERMMQIMIDGVSTRRYKNVVPEMAESVGISKSAVSRANIEAGEKLLKELAERRFDDLDILILYIDGIALSTAIYARDKNSSLEGAICRGQGNLSRQATSGLLEYYPQLSYFVWVSIATVLQVFITVSNV